MKNQFPISISFFGCRLVLMAFAGVLAGCKTPPPSATRNARTTSPDPAQLNPVETFNTYLGAIARGDQTTMRAFIYVQPGESETTRLERSIAVLGSTARLRQAFDVAYGNGSLSKLGFQCYAEGTRLPKGASFKIEGGDATISAPGWDTIRMVCKGVGSEESIERIEYSGVAAFLCQALPVC